MLAAVMVVIISPFFFCLLKNGGLMGKYRRWKTSMGALWNGKQKRQ